jgi:hypothetical protein
LETLIPWGGRKFHPQTLLASPPAAVTASIIATRLARSGFGHVYLPTVDILAIQRGDSGRSRFICCHFDEGKTSRPSGVAICHHINRGHLSMRRKQLSQLVLGCVKAHVADVHFFGHVTCSTFCLLGHNVDGLQTFGALLDRKLDALSLVQISETLHHDGRMVNKHILGTLSRDEAIAFGAVEPLHDSDFPIIHDLPSFQKLLVFP